MAGNLNTMNSTPAPHTVRGKWFIPTIYVGFLLFTLAMSFGTIYLGQAMRPMLERRQIEAKKLEMQREAAARAAQSRPVPEAKP